MVFQKQYTKDIQSSFRIFFPGVFFFHIINISLAIRTTFIFLLLFCITVFLSAQNHSGNASNEKNNAYHQIYEKAKFYQNSADSTQKVIRVLRDELSLETNTKEKKLLEKRILKLEKKQREYQKNANIYLKRARELKNNIDLKDQKERQAEISGYSDAFYKLPAVSNLITAEEWQTLYTLEPFYSEGTELMQKIAKLKNEKNQLVILTNTSPDRQENKNLKSQIEDLNTQIRNMENRAFIQFQKVHQRKYKINSGIINRITRDAEQGSQKIILSYKNNAIHSYKKSLELLKEAENATNKEKQFDLLGESNAYALLAVETQKKAIGTYSGTFTGNTSGMQIAFSNTPSNIATNPDTINNQENIKEKQGTPGDTLAYLNQFKITIDDNEDDYTIPVDKPIPAGIIYQIQIGVYRKIPSKEFFKGIRPLTAETIPSSQNLRFLAGLFSSYKDAVHAIDTIHALGFKDAFIISYLDQKKTPVKEARKMESNTINSNSTLPVPKTPVSIEIKQPVNLPEDVFFTVQIGAFYNKIPKERTDNISLYAGNEPIIDFRNKKGLFVYTIGKFYTFEKAVAFKNKLIENGLEDAYIIAFRTNQKIPLDEAIQLLSKKY